MGWKNPDKYEKIAEITEIIASLNEKTVNIAKRKQ